MSKFSFSVVVSILKIGIRFINSLYHLICIIVDLCDDGRLNGTCPDWLKSVQELHDKFTDFVAQYNLVIDSASKSSEDER